MATPPDAALVGKSLPGPVLHVCLSHSWGGEEMTVLAMALAQRELGLSVAVAAREGRQLAIRAREAELPVLGYRAGIDRVLFPFRARTFVREQGIKVLHAHHLRGLVRAGLLLPEGHPRVVLTEHAPRERAPRNPLERWILGRVAVIHAASPVVIEASSRALGVGPATFRLVPLGIDLGRFSPQLRRDRRAAARARFGLGTGEVAILLPGRISETKNQIVAVEALARLGGKAAGGDLCGGPSGAGPVLLLAGEDKELIAGSVGYHRELLATIDRLGLGRRVRFLGFLEEVADAYAAADLVVMPSRFETFGLAVAEAMACGVPVAVSDRGALPRLVRDGETGWVVPGTEPEAWAEALARILADGTGREARGRAAASWVASELDAGRQHARIVDLYNPGPCPATPPAES